MIPMAAFIVAVSPQILFISLLISIPSVAKTANIPSNSDGLEVASDVQVDCNSDEIVVSISTKSGRFNGMVYPRGLSKNSSCLGEWVQRKSPIQYRLPLRGCNTMSTDLPEVPVQVQDITHRADEFETAYLEDEVKNDIIKDNGGIEYFNTIVVQPHLKLVTNQGRGFHIRCQYDTRNNSAATNDSLNVEMTPSEAALETAALTPMPGCSMKIFSGDPLQKEVAENVKIGDPLTLVISIDEQDTYGIRVTDCLVRDGLGWGEQKLINQEGCPTDSDIMGMFEYFPDRTKATVHFQAHKFPYTASVYYQCNVKLCLKADDECDLMAPACGGNRIRRQSGDELPPARVTSEPIEGTPATIEVYSGLYVNEANDLNKVDPKDDSVFSEKASDSICISQRSFAIGICIAGLVLMLCVVFAILCLFARRRKKSVSIPGSSIYSGPYTNTAYSHTS